MCAFTFWLSPLQAEDPVSVKEISQAILNHVNDNNWCLFRKLTYSLTYYDMKQRKELAATKAQGMYSFTVAFR